MQLTIIALSEQGANANQDRLLGFHGRWLGCWGSGGGQRPLQLTYPVMKRLAPLLALLLLAAAAAAVLLLREPEPEPEPEAPVLEEGDTGFSRQAVEERMRAIGYVQ